MIQERLVAILADAAERAAPELGLEQSDLPAPELSRPNVREHGDWATNLALVLAGRAKRPPRAVAEAIQAHLDEADLIARTEVAGPGFINMFLRPSWLHDALRTILERGAAFGSRAGPQGERVQVEFVSANPTGPLHVGHARNAAIGDALANVLAADGYDVEREYYFNDTGGQMDRFGESVAAAYLRLFGRDAEAPEDGYGGAYIDELASTIGDEAGDAYLELDPEERRRSIQAAAVEHVLGWIRATLERFGVRFDE